MEVHKKLDITFFTIFWWYSIYVVSNRIPTYHFYECTLNLLFYLSVWNRLKRQRRITLLNWKTLQLVTLGKCIQAWKIIIQIVYVKTSNGLSTTTFQLKKTIVCLEIHLLLTKYLRKNLNKFKNNSSNEPIIWNIIQFIKIKIFKLNVKTDFFVGT